ncbi:MAG TPA: 3-hydroxyacyl-CoA dehydrogenase NAD-binding domain-containing protein, partial [Chitinophagales bacterium]
DLLQKAYAFILANKTAKQPWDEDGYKLPGGTATTPKVASMLPIVPAMLAKKTNNNYPAPLAIISTAVEGSVVDFETATRIESRYFTQLATSKVAKNMINAFWKQLNEINAGKSRPAPSNSPEVGEPIQKKYAFKKVGVLGAGMMGSGIAYSAAVSGFEVVLKDVSQESADKGKAYSENLLKKRVSKGKSTQEKADEILNRIKATADVNDLRGCDLIIEAVFENRELKAKVTQESEAVMDASGVFASNTSTLPITGLATKSSRPKQFIGLHFFSPADRMPLVEIIVAKETSDETLARAFDFVKQIKKTPIVVNDSRGFYTSRVFATYVLEGIAMLGEGHHPHSIEAAGTKAGMPVGPLALTDEVSLSLLAHIRKQTLEDLKAEGKETPAHAAYAVADKLIALGREGKAKGAGFYDYPKDGKKHLWSGLNELFHSQFSKEPQDDTELQERLLFVQVLDTVRCLEEGVLRSVADANIGSIFGWGFAPFKGGTLQYINDYSLSKFIARANELHAKYGERFAVPKLLVEMEKEGKGF